jgi:hypothetical protein
MITVYDNNNNNNNNNDDEYSETPFAPHNSHGHVKDFSKNYRSAILTEWFSSVSPGECRDCRQ